jgi:beta-lactam-binding protein with PASTA domain
MLRVGALFAVALFGCQIQGGGRSPSGPSSTPPPSSSSSESEASSSPPPSPSSDDRVVATASAGTVKVPDVNQLETFEAAKQKLRAAGLTGEIEPGYDHDNPAGEIACGTKPDAGQLVSADFSIEVIMCIEGRQLVGMTLDAAKAEIARMRAVVHTQKTGIKLVDGTCAHGTVCAVDPKNWDQDVPDEIVLIVGK